MSLTKSCDVHLVYFILVVPFRDAFGIEAMSLDETKRSGTSLSSSMVNVRQEAETS